MNVTTLVLNTNGDPHFQSEEQYNIENLFEVAKEREMAVRQEGREWAAGAIPFFGKELVNAVKTGEHKDVSNAIIQMLMATWLFDFVYCGATAASYIKSDIEFTVAHDGSVAYNRIDAKNSAH
ncbi:hypothetical protein [Undibacterium sp. Ji49W]|uniref:hypothetical protein n=1 Tax=Undibacterium sp. Ji49W TaxID=3413040 RepID=UPI003BF2CFA7